MYACKLFLTVRPPFNDDDSHDVFCKNTFPSKIFSFNREAGLRGLLNDGTNDLETHVKNQKSGQLNNLSVKARDLFSKFNKSNILLSKYLQLIENLYRKFLTEDDLVTKKIFLLTSLGKILWSELVWFYDTLQIKSYRLFHILGNNNQSEDQFISKKSVMMFVTMELYDLTEKDDPTVEELIKQTYKKNNSMITSNFLISVRGQYEALVKKKQDFEQKNGQEADPVLNRGDQENKMPGENSNDSASQNMLNDIESVQLNNFPNSNGENFVNKDPSNQSIAVESSKTTSDQIIADLSRAQVNNNNYISNNNNNINNNISNTEKRVEDVNVPKKTEQNVGPVKFIDQKNIDWAKNEYRQASNPINVFVNPKIVNAQALNDDIAKLNIKQNENNIPSDERFNNNVRKNSLRDNDNLNNNLYNNQSSNNNNFDSDLNNNKLYLKWRDQVQQSNNQNPNPQRFQQQVPLKNNETQKRSKKSFKKLVRNLKHKRKSHAKKFYLKKRS